MRAGRNPLSVLHIFRFAAYLNQMQNSIVLFGFAPCGSDLSFLLWKPQIVSSSYAPSWIFSALLPAISDCLSPDHNFCMERGVSSAVAAFVHQLTLVKNKYFFNYFNLPIQPSFASKNLSSYLPFLAFTLDE